MKTIYTYSILFILAVIFISVTAFYSENGNNKLVQDESRIKFSHSLHYDLVSCEDCHQGVTESITLKDRMFPEHSSCESCHDVDDGDNCMMCHYDDNFSAIEKRVSKLIFNHKFHIKNEQISCESCHKGFSEVEYSFQAKQPHPFMKDCYTCHNDSKVATNACESCHISTHDLLPADHKSMTFMKNHKFAFASNSNDCMMCHDNNSNNCIDCHMANNIAEVNLSNDYYKPYSSTSFTGTRIQKVNRVHELNYRFVHGIDAKFKSNDCMSCHQVETFCSQCHASENQDFALSGIMPASHIKPGFFTIGVGSGGGEHAKLARRDLASCASCHDTNGADPTCINCHLDSDGIKGTNPKTHTNGFMRSIRGDWHDSQGSVCYNCHTSSTPQSLAGTGFCGYCHGMKN